MDAGTVHDYIWQGIQKKVYADRIELHLPFYFGNNNDKPLCLTWDRNGILSDGGRTIAELEKRDRNIHSYMDTVRMILSQCGDCKLVGGRIIIKENFQTVISRDTQYQDYLGGMNDMLEAIARISVLKPVSEFKKGAVLA